MSPGQRFVTSKGVMSSFRRCCLRGAFVAMWCTPPTRGRPGSRSKAVHIRATERCGAKLDRLCVCIVGSAFTSHKRSDEEQFQGEEWSLGEMCVSRAAECDVVIREVREDKGCWRVQDSQGPSRDQGDLCRSITLKESRLGQHR
jgi:hypothetical protein